MKNHKEEMNDERFVGNTSKLYSSLKYFDLNNINYRLGNTAFDKHGEIIKSNIIKPLFIKKDSLEKYDKLMRKLSGFTTNVEGIILE